jgi:hypothetical protein
MGKLLNRIKEMGASYLKLNGEALISIGKSKSRGRYGMTTGEFTGGTRLGVKVNDKFRESLRQNKYYLLS